MSRTSGTVKWFNVAKGYGYITTTDGSDVFVHHAAIRAEGFRTLGEGEAVEFIVNPTAKGPEAQDVSGPGGAAVKGNNRRRTFKKREPREGSSAVRPLT